MRSLRVVGIVVTLVAGLCAAVAPANASNNRPALPLTIVIRGLSGQEARVRVTGPRRYDRTFRISDRRRLRNLRPGQYRLRARAVGQSSASVRDQRVRVNRKRGAKVFFNYRVPVPPPPPTPSIPGAVTDLRATSVTATAITLAWTNPASGFSGIRVNRTGGPGSLVVSTGQNGLTDTALLPNTAYTYTVTPVGTGGDGPTSTLVVTTLAPGIIASGATVSCAASQAGAMRCWGTGSALGTGIDPSTSAQPVSGGRPVSAIARGTDHTCSISSGQVWCWGENAMGQLGNGTTDASTVPVQVTLPNNVPAGQPPATSAVAIAAGNQRTCAVADNAMLYCWGDYGTGSQTSPQWVNILNRGVRFVGANANRVCAITTNNEIACLDPSGVAVQVLGTSGAYSGLAVGADHSCALSTTGVATCWGINDSGQLGTGNTTTSTTPVPVAGGLLFRQVAAGDNASCGITTAGAAACWGDNTVTPVSLTPQDVAMPAGSVVTAISAGQTSCAINNGIQAFCWGVGSAFQLGNGVAANSGSPVQVVGFP